MKLTTFVKNACLPVFLLCAGVTKAQTNANLVLKDSTTLSSTFSGKLSRGTLLKTANNHYYEISENIKQQAVLSQSSIVKVYKDGKKLKIEIQGIDQMLTCNKVDDVIESNIDGDFRGYDGNTTFKLTNQQQWKQDITTSPVMSNLYRPAVLIYRTPEGYKMKITGLNEDPILVRKVE
jgi:hypothetical protein